MSNTNSLLFDSWTQRAIDLKQIEALQNVDILATNVSVASRYARTGTTAFLRNPVIKAICKIAEINNKGAGALGTFTRNGETHYAVEIIDKGVREAAVIVNNKVETLKLIATTPNKQYETYMFHKTHDDGALIFTAIILYESMEAKDAEFIAAIKGAQIALKNGITDANLVQFTNDCALVCDNLYRRMASDDYPIRPLGDTGNVGKISNVTLTSGRYTPSVVYKGTFEILANSSSVQMNVAPQKPQIIQTEPVKNILIPAAEFSAEDKRLIPKNPIWYIRPPEVDEICQLIRDSSNMYKPIRTVELRGESSTGKTCMAKAIASTLQYPYRFTTCCADTESYAFTGQPMYDKDGAVKFVEGELVKAIRGPGVYEVQEPAVISKQGILTIFNGLLDDCRGITLSTGEYVERHPESIIIFTTNSDYVGCKKPNQSVLRRMNNLFDIKKPDDAVIVQRIQSITRLDNVDLIKKMVEVMNQIRPYLKENSIDDGVCGVEEVLDWANTYCINHNVKRAAEITIVSKATDEEEAQAHIVGLIDAKFTDDYLEALDNIQNTALPFA